MSTEVKVPIVGLLTSALNPWSWRSIPLPIPHNFLMAITWPFFSVALYTFPPPPLPITFSSSKHSVTSLYVNVVRWNNVILQGDNRSPSFIAPGLDFCLWQKYHIARVARVALATAIASTPPIMHIAKVRDIVPFECFELPILHEELFLVWEEEILLVPTTHRSGFPMKFDDAEALEKLVASVRVPEKLLNEQLKVTKCWSFTLSRAVDKSPLRLLLEISRYMRFSNFPTSVGKEPDSLFLDKPK